MSNELEYLKSLVSQLNAKIDALEGKAKAAVEKTKPFEPAKELRLILVGPPGAGAFQWSVFIDAIGVFAEVFPGCFLMACLWSGAWRWTTRTKTYLLSHLPNLPRILSVLKPWASMAFSFFVFVNRQRHTGSGYPG